VKGSVENRQISFKRNVVRRFLAEMEGEGKLNTPELVRQFMALPSTQQAQRIKLETGDRFQPDIVIGRNPGEVADFQRFVQPILTRTCGNVNCHGGGQLGFKLLPKATTPPEVYANFFSLDTYRTGQGNLVDHSKPEESLLLSFLLPAGQSSDKRAHPTQIVPPPVRTTKDARYQQVLKWIRGLPVEPIDRAIGESGISTRPAAALGGSPAESPRSREPVRKPK
jgi:predicted CxxxxCH...CXXCH cytochrome family protein